MTRFAIRAMAALVFLAPAWAETGITPRLPVSKEYFSTQAKADCIPCKVKCKRCFVPGKRWNHVAECYADCDAKGVKWSTASCREYKRCPWGD